MFGRLSLGGKFLLAVAPLIMISSLGTVAHYVLVRGASSEGQALDSATRIAAAYAIRAGTEAITFVADPREAQRSRTERARADFSQAKSRYDALRERRGDKTHEERVASLLERLNQTLQSLMDRAERVGPLLDRAYSVERTTRRQLLGVLGSTDLGLTHSDDFSNAALAVLRAEGTAGDEASRFQSALSDVRTQVGSSGSAKADEARASVETLASAIEAYRDEAEPLANEVTELSQIRQELDDIVQAAISKQASNGAAQQGVTAAIVVALLQCTVGVAAILLLGRSVRRRLGAVAEGAHTIARGDLGARVPDEGNDEISVLGKAFNEMASQLETSTVSRADLEDREAALRVSEQRLRLLVEQLKDCAIFMVSTTGAITSWNAGAERLYGYREPEAMSLPLANLFPVRSGAVSAAELLDRAAASGGYALESEQARKDGTRFLAEIAISPLDTVKTITAHVVLVRDVTGKRAAEHERQQHLDQLAHVGRLSVMGEMAAGLAHELNQPLGAINNYAEGSLLRLIDGKVTPEMLRDILERIAAQAQRAGEIIHRVRVFARKEGVRSEEVDLRSAIERVVALLDHDAGKLGIDMKVDLARNVPKVIGDPVQIEQVLVNLIRNAFEAIAAVREAGRVRRVTIHAALNDEGGASLSVQDTGCGVGEGEEARLFEAFYTTKPEGLGMGLAITRTIVEAHGGRIWMERNADHGMTVHVNLPRRPGVE